MPIVALDRSYLRDNILLNSRQQPPNCQTGVIVVVCLSCSSRFGASTSPKQNRKTNQKFSPHSSLRVWECMFHVCMTALDSNYMHIQLIHVSR